MARAFVPILFLVLALGVSLCTGQFDPLSQNCSYFRAYLDLTAASLGRLSDFASLPPINTNCSSKSDIPTYIANVDAALRAFESYRAHVGAAAAATAIPVMFMKHQIELLYKTMESGDVTAVRASQLLSRALSLTLFNLSI